MTAAPSTVISEGSIDPDEMVLRAVSDGLRSSIETEVRQFRLATSWAELHPGNEVDLSIPWTDRELEIAGDGAPTVAEFAIAEFALAAGMSTDAGRNYLGDAVEVRFRLPLLWERVTAGEVRVYKARRIAQATRSLSPDAAAYVDRHVARVARSCSYAQIEREVEAARDKYDAAAVEDERLAASDNRHFRIRTDEVTSNGLVHVEGLVDLPSALALESAIADRARTLLESDPTLPLNHRRAMAVGMLGDATSQTEIVLYAHTSPDGHGLVNIDNTRSLVTFDELIEWCSLAGAKVTLEPVIDLSTELCRNGYTPTPAQHEQAILIHPTCVYPGCSRPSRGCDLDHIVPWPLGRTTSANLAPLCRGHHRLKTHGSWSYVRTGRTTFVWTSPTGRRYDGDDPSGRHLR